MNRRLFHHLLLLCPVLLAAQAAPHDPALAIETEDLRIEQRADGGFHLFIRKKPGILSVLLTESTRDPALRSPNYAYRAAEWNAVNGGEIRVLDGEVLPKSSEVWSLIDSTPELDEELGEAYHIYIPYILYYGYEDSRSGEVYVVDGTYLNIRAFSLPYGDYRGSFRDNPFVLRAVQQPLPGPPGENYMKETEEAFSEISGWNGERPVYSSGPADIVEKIRDILEKQRNPVMDIVICLDTTRSMKDDIGEIRKNLVPMIKDVLGETPEFRIGMVLYKDYYEEYLTRIIPFTSDPDRIQRVLDGVTPWGGKDIPEAVYEALYDGALKFPWEAENRLMILIGDAPPHLRQRGKVSKEMVREAAEERNIRLFTIILPQ